MSASSSLRARRTANDLKFSAPNSEGALRPAPFGELVDRALALVRKNALFYAIFAAIVLGLQALWYTFYHGREAMLLAFDIVVLVFFTIVINIRTALDLRGGELPLGELLGWAFGRFWAVLIIDLFVWLSISAGADLTFAPQSADAFLGGVLLLVLTSTFIFCDVVASVEPQPRWYAIVPAAIRRSVGLAWQNGNISRALAIVVFQATFGLVGVLAQALLSAAHVKGAAFLANQPLNTLLTPFFATLTTVVYFDALARERETVE